MLEYPAALDWTVCHWNANLAAAKWHCASHLVLLPQVGRDPQLENPCCNVLHRAMVHWQAAQNHANNERGFAQLVSEQRLCSRCCSMWYHARDGNLQLITEPTLLTRWALNIACGISCSPITHPVIFQAILKTFINRFRYVWLGLLLDSAGQRVPRSRAEHACIYTQYIVYIYTIRAGRYGPNNYHNHFFHFSRYR